MKAFEKMAPLRATRHSAQDLRSIVSFSQEIGVIISILQMRKLKLWDVE